MHGDGTTFDMPTEIIGHIKKINENTLNRFKNRFQRNVYQPRTLYHTSADIYQRCPNGTKTVPKTLSERCGNSIVVKA